MALLRGSQEDLRMQRATTGTGSRIGDTNRAEHTGRGTYINFYEDIGLSTTEAGAKSIREGEAAFQGEVSAKQKEISAANKELTASKQRVEEAKKNSPSFKSAMDKAWTTAQKGFVPVRVVDASGNKVEATYMLPKSVIPELQKIPVHSNWVDDGKAFNISVKTRDGGHIVGQEIHDSIRNATQGVYSSFQESTAPQVAKLIAESDKQFAKAYSDLAGYESQISSAKGMLEGSKSQRDKMWADARADYQKKMDNFSNILGNLKVK